MRKKVRNGTQRIYAMLFLLAFSAFGIAAGRMRGLFAVPDGEAPAASVSEARAEEAAGTADVSEAEPERTASPSGSASPSAASPSAASPSAAGPNAESAGNMLLAARSGAIDDLLESPSYFSNFVRDLQVTIEKLANGNLVFRITGRVKGPYSTTSNYYRYYWGPFMAFTLNGRKASPGLMAINDKNSYTEKKYQLLPNEYDYYKVGGLQYNWMRFLNQTGMLTQENTDVRLRAGETLYAYSAPGHQSVSDGCAIEKIALGTIVSFSDNTPARGWGGSADFDLEIRMELRDLHERVSGFYVGSFEHGYYSESDADSNDRYVVSTGYLDCSEQLQNARKEKVTLRFDAGAGSGGPGTVELMPGSAYMPAAAAPPQGWRFNGWQGWNGTVPGTDTVYPAEYLENQYHIRFETAGGSAVGALNNVPYRSSQNRFPETKRKGYVFEGWRFDGGSD